MATRYPTSRLFVLVLGCFRNCSIVRLINLPPHTIQANFVQGITLACSHFVCSCVARYGPLALLLYRTFAQTRSVQENPFVDKLQIDIKSKWRHRRRKISLKVRSPLLTTLCSRCHEDQADLYIQRRLSLLTWYASHAQTVLDHQTYHIPNNRAMTCNKRL